MAKTRALAALARWGVPFEVRTFDATEYTAEEAAHKLELPPDMIFKTLVVQGERRGYAVALIPGNASLSLRKMAAALDDKRVELIAVEDIERITGYIKGGVSPFGLKRSMPAFVDSAVFHYPTVSVSAGQRGMQILLAPAHLVDAAQATVEQLTDE